MGEKSMCSVTCFFSPLMICHRHLSVSVHADFLLMYCPIAWIYDDLYHLVPVDGQLGSFQYFSVIEKAAVKILVLLWFFVLLFNVSLGLILEEEFMKGIRIALVSDCLLKMLYKYTLLQCRWVTHFPAISNPQYYQS